MEILIEWNVKYQNIYISDGGTTLDLGLHDESERIELAQKFLDAAEELLRGIEVPEIFPGTLKSLMDLGT